MSSACGFCAHVNCCSMSAGDIWPTNADEIVPSLCSQMVVGMQATAGCVAYASAY